MGARVGRRPGQQGSAAPSTHSHPLYPPTLRRTWLSTRSSLSRCCAAASCAAASRMPTSARLRKPSCARACRPSSSSSARASASSCAGGCAQRHRAAAPAGAGVQNRHDLPSPASALAPAATMAQVPTRPGMGVVGRRRSLAQRPAVSMRSAHIRLCGEQPALQALGCCLQLAALAAAGFQLLARGIQAPAQRRALGWAHAWGRSTAGESGTCDPIPPPSPTGQDVPPPYPGSPLASRATCSTCWCSRRRRDSSASRRRARSCSCRAFSVSAALLVGTRGGVAELLAHLQHSSDPPACAAKAPLLTFAAPGRPSHAPPRRRRPTGSGPAATHPPTAVGWPGSLSAVVGGGGGGAATADPPS